MKTVMKFGIVLVVLALVTSMASAATFKGGDVDEDVTAKSTIESGDTLTAGSVTIGKDDDDQVTVTIDAGGSMIVAGDLKISENDDNDCELNIAGVLSVGGKIQTSDDDGALSTINVLDGGVVTADRLNVAADLGDDDGDTYAEVNLYGNGTLTVNDFDMGESNDARVELFGTSRLVVEDDDEATISSDDEDQKVRLVLNDDSYVSFNKNIRTRKGDDTKIIVNGNATLEIGGRVRFGDDKGSTTLEINGGLVDIDGSDGLRLADNSSSDGTIDMSGGVLTVRKDIDFANSGEGTLLMDGGTINVGDDIETGSKATIDMDAGTINVADTFYMEKGVDFDMDGGLVDVSGKMEWGSSDGKGRLELGDGATQAKQQFDGGSEYVAVIEVDELKMGNAVAGDDWIDIILGGLLIIDDGDKTGMVADLVADGLILTTESSLVTNWLLPGVDQFDVAQVAWDYDLTISGKTSVYLVPEPATMFLLGLGGLVLRRRKR